MTEKQVTVFGVPVKLSDLERLERMITHRPEAVCIGAQGDPSPPEPAKGMNGPTGNKGSPGIVGVPEWGCDPGSGEMWITGDNTIAGEVGESQSYVSRHGAALSRAPEIPVTDEMVAAADEVAEASGWTLGCRVTVASLYRAMRAKEPPDLFAIMAASSYAVREALARAEAAETETGIVTSKLRGLQQAHDILCSSYRVEIRELKAELAKRDASFSRLRFRK